jgi:pimeloyl-ACP methyl ester carboxylesterase
VESYWREFGVFDFMVCMKGGRENRVEADEDRAYASLFTTKTFTHMIFVDQAPLQNSDPVSGWDHRFCNRGMNNPMAVASFQTTLALAPEIAHKGTIAACLSYRSHPRSTDQVTVAKWEEDDAFFLGEAMRGRAHWYGKLMADHTAIDWRDTIKASFGSGSGSKTFVLVLASSRSGCFPADGPMKVVEIVNEGGTGRANGTVVEWGGHWMYWEDPEKFDRRCLDFLESPEWL